MRAKLREEGDKKCALKNCGKQVVTLQYEQRSFEKLGEKIGGAAETLEFSVFIFFISYLLCFDFPFFIFFLCLSLSLSLSCFLLRSLSLFALFWAEKFLSLVLFLFFF